MTDICEFNIDRYMKFFKKSYFDRYMPEFFIFWSIYENFQKTILSIYRSKFWSVYIYRSIYFNIDRYMFSYSDHILFYISGVIRPLHISVNISPLRLNHFNITYIDQYMPTSGIYRSIYVIFHDLSLGLILARYM